MPAIIRLRISLLLKLNKRYGVAAKYKLAQKAYQYKTYCVR
ncbi:MAG: hypothetical protein ACI9PC_000020 [Porticoccaceae bacterium]|jgi:hypothetical protein